MHPTVRISAGPWNDAHAFPEKCWVGQFAGRHACLFAICLAYAWYARPMPFRLLSLFYVYEA